MSDKHSKHHPLRVFISHSGVDQVFAGKLRNLLFHRVNAQVFTADDLSAGEKWETKLRNELSAADVVVALLSPSSVESSWVLQEIGAAWALQKPILPVVTTRNVLNKMPLTFERAQVVELTDVESPENAEKFLDAFEKSMAALHAA
jgi:nucleoside 2-deoxyribosyltransferase